jgi:type IV secretory pathway TrbF-like protein
LRVAFRLIRAQETAAMKLADFLKQVESLDPETILCVAEVDEAFGAEVASVEIIDNARQRSDQAFEQEAIELANGDRKAVVLRW